MEEGRGNSDAFFYKEFVKRPVSKPVRRRQFLGTVRLGLLGEKGSTSKL